MDDGAGSVDEFLAGSHRAGSRSHRANPAFPRPIRALSPIGRSSAVRRRNGRFHSRQMRRRQALHLQNGETGETGETRETRNSDLWKRGNVREGMRGVASHGSHGETGGFVHARAAGGESRGHAAAVRGQSAGGADGARELRVFGGGGGVVGAGKAGRSLPIAVRGDGKAGGVGVARAGGAREVLFCEGGGVGEAVGVAEAEGETWG